MRVRPTVLLFAKKRKPRAFRRIEENWPESGYWMRPRYLRVWRVPPGELTKADKVDSLPIVGAMRATPEEIDLVIDRLSRVEDRERRSELSAEFVTWCSLNYNRDEVGQFRARLGMASTKDVLMASPIGEEIREYGKREGVEEGLAKGRREGKREGIEEGRRQGIEEGKRENMRANLVSLAEARFPGVLQPGFANRLSSLEALESMFRTMLRAQRADQVKNAFARLVGRRR
jgi:hypothetical protein